MTLSHWKFSLTQTHWPVYVNVAVFWAGSNLFSPLTLFPFSCFSRLEIEVEQKGKWLLWFSVLSSSFCVVWFEPSTLPTLISLHDIQINQISQTNTPKIVGLFFSTPVLIMVYSLGLSNFKNLKALKFQTKTKPQCQHFFLKVMRVIYFGVKICFSMQLK